MPGKESLDPVDCRLAGTGPNVNGLLEEREFAFSHQHVLMLDLPHWQRLIVIVEHVIRIHFVFGGFGANTIMQKKYKLSTYDRLNTNSQPNASKPNATLNAMQLMKTRI